MPLLAISLLNTVHYKRCRQIQLKYFTYILNIKVGSFMARRKKQWRIYYHSLWGQLSTTAVKLLKQTNCQLRVAVDHSQLRTMASEMVDPIDWPLPPTLYSAVPPERHLLGANADHKSQVQSVERERVTFGTLGHRIAYAATQGSKINIR